MRGAFHLWRNMKDEDAKQAGVTWRPRCVKRPNTTPGPSASQPGV